MKKHFLLCLLLFVAPGVADTLYIVSGDCGDCGFTWDATTQQFLDATKVPECSLAPTFYEGLPCPIGSGDTYLSVLPGWPNAIASIQFFPALLGPPDDRFNSEVMVLWMDDGEGDDMWFDLQYNIFAGTYPNLIGFTGQTGTFNLLPVGVHAVPGGPAKTLTVTDVPVMTPEPRTAWLTLIAMIALIIGLWSGRLKQMCAELSTTNLLDPSDRAQRTDFLQAVSGKYGYPVCSVVTFQSLSGSGVRSRPTADTSRSELSSPDVHLPLPMRTWASKIALLRAARWPTLKHLT